MERDEWFFDADNDVEVGLGIMGIIINLIMLGIEIMFMIASFLITHFYIVNGLMMGAIPAALMSYLGCDEVLSGVVFGVVALVVIILQLKLKIARIVFGSLGCVFVAIIVWLASVDLEEFRLRIMSAVGAVLVTALFNLIGNSGE